jgi:hypothetical protein
MQEFEGLYSGNTSASKKFGMGTQKVLRVVVALGFSVSFGTFLVSSVSP